MPTLGAAAKAAALARGGVQKPGRASKSTNVQALDLASAGKATFGMQGAANVSATILQKVNVTGETAITDKIFAFMRDERGAPVRTNDATRDRQLREWAIRQFSEGNYVDQHFALGILDVELGLGLKFNPNPLDVGFSSKKIKGKHQLLLKETSLHGENIKCVKPEGDKLMCILNY